MKKVLHVIAQYPGKTGSGIFLKSLVSEVDKLGYKQAVIGATTRKLEKVDFKSTNVKFYPVEFNTERINFDIVGMSDIMPYESSKYSDLSDDMYDIWSKSFLEVLTKAIDEFKPDVIISHHLFILTSIVNKIRGKIKLIVLSQGTELRQLNLAPRFRDMVIKRCEGVDMVCALNSYQREEISNIYNIDKDKIKVMGVGYNSDIFYFEENKKKHRQIVFAGKISSSKGLKSLISSFKKIEDNNIKLLIAGSGEEEENMKSLSMPDERIKFLGALSQEQLADLLRESEAFILPSFYEGLPLVIMEALSCGAKVIISDIKGVKEWVGENINSGGAINYIPLPRLINVDVPLEEDLDDFENKIKEKILSEIDRNVDFSSIYSDIKKRSWEEYLRNLSNYF